MSIGIDLTAIDATAKFKLGTIMSVTGADTTGTKSYKYILYANGTAAVAGVAGEVAYYFATTGFLLNKVTSDLSDSGSQGAGVLQASLTDGSYGWIQILGQATLSIALTVDSDNVNLTPVGAADGSLDVVDTTSAITANAGAVCAISGNAGEKDIMCCFPH